jgi:hypothetical protein
MKKLLFLLLTAALLVACGHDDTADEAPAYTMTSDEAVSAFLDDADGASKKYVDQIIQISGPIMELQKENGQVTGVKLSSDEFNIVNGSLQFPIDAENIQEKDGVITIKGVCSGFLGDTESMLPGGTVELKRVTFVQ